MPNRSVRVALVLAFVVGVPAVHADENPPDQYLCYLAGTTKNKRLQPISGDVVTLQDRFAAPQTFTLRRLASLCNPASVELSPISHFGDDPTESAAEINRFKCYTVALPKGAAKFSPPAPPFVKDEVFPNGQAFIIKKPARVCFAASADGAPDDGPTRPKALMCYGVKLPSGVKFQRQTVGTHGRTVGARVVGRRKPSELCVLATVS